MLQAIVFDIDGTLVDSVDLHAEAWQEAFHHFGYEIRFRDIRQQIGKGGDQLMPEFIPQSELKRIEEPLEHYRSQLWKRKYLPLVRPFPRVRELFQELKQRGYRLGLASSAKADEIGAYARLARVEGLMDVATSADDVDCSKPCPDVFAEAIKKLRCKPDEAVVIGDSPYDAHAAAKIGTATIGVLCGGFLEEQLRAAGCVAIYADPTELLFGIDDWTQMRRLRAA